MRPQQGNQHARQRPDELDKSHAQCKRHRLRFGAQTRVCEKLHVKELHHADALRRRDRNGGDQKADRHIHEVVTNTAAQAQGAGREERAENDGDLQRQRVP